MLNSGTFGSGAFGTGFFGEAGLKIAVSDSIYISDVVTVERKILDIVFTAYAGGTITPRFVFSGTVIEAFVNDASEGTFTSGVGKAIVVSDGDEIRYASSNPWTNITEVDFSDDKISGDIAQFAPFTSLTDLELYNTQISGNLSALAALVALTTLSVHTTDVTADAGCLDTQILMTTLAIHDCRLSPSEMETLMASLIINEVAGEPARDCAVTAD